MITLDRALLILIGLLAMSADYNSREAHRHMHELACHVHADELCSFHHGTKE